MEYRIFSENTLVIQYVMRLGILIALSLQTYALSRSRNKKGNLWMFAVLVLMIPIYMNDNEFFNTLSINVARGVNIALYFPVILIPTLSYFAILYYIKPTRRFSNRDMLLFVPMVIDWSMLLPIIIYPQIKTEWSGWSAYSSISNYIVEPIFILFSFYLWYQAFQHLREHSRDVKLLHSSIEQVDLKWLYGFALCIPLLFVSHFLREMFFVELLYDLGDIVAMGVILFLSWNITQQRDVFPYEISVDTIKEQIVEVEPTKINGAAYDVKAEELEELMRGKQLYLNPNLNLGDLAYYLNIRPQELSNLLTNRFSVNFYSYVNKYRVEQCKRLLEDGQNINFSMEGIASKAGFKSKSTFYVRFKEFTGLTPLQYQDKLHQQFLATSSKSHI